jgi:hypothetical protein
MVIPNILWEIIQMFQTTNQYPYVEILLPTMETHIIVHQHNGNCTGGHSIDP